MIVEDHWAMMRWLQQFIDENKYDWEKRRKREEELERVDEEYEKWKGMGDDEMIRIMKEEEERMESVKVRAERRKGYWRNWRKGTSKEDEEVRDDHDGNKDQEDQDMINQKMFVGEMKRRRLEWKEEKKVKFEMKKNKEHPVPVAPRLETTDTGELNSKMNINKNEEDLE